MFAATLLRCVLAPFFHRPHIRAFTDYFAHSNLVRFHCPGQQSCQRARFGVSLLNQNRTG